MATALKHPDPLDADRLLPALQALADGEVAPAPTIRRRILRHLKGSLDAGRAEIRRRFDSGASGAETVAANAVLIDRHLRAIFDFTSSRVYPAGVRTAGEHLAVAAVGGYGRAELAPFSDIDLLFLVSYKLTPRVEQIIEYVLYLLWDCGFKVGHATRSLDDCVRLSRADVTIRTSILEARHLTGDEHLFDALGERFRLEVVKDTGPRFVEDKLAERDARHQRMGDSRYVLEPNIKDGKGGQRDLQTLFWIARDLYGVKSVDDLVAHGVLNAKEAARFAKAQNFLWTVRCHLHYLSNRGEDRLTFDLQEEIGRRMGYKDHAGARGVERFMKHYYLIAKEVGDLTRIFCAALEAEHRRPFRFALPAWGMFRREVAGFALAGGRLTLKTEAELKSDPVRMIRLFHAAQTHDLDIHPNALRFVTRNLRLVDGIRNDAEANRLFMEIMTSNKAPEIALRRLNEAGVMGRFIPDFGRVVAQMQHDMYHVFTVDEHTIIAIGIVGAIEDGRFADEMPAASEAVHQIVSRKALFLGVLLHDIAKGRGGNHSEIGAAIALKLGPRLGLTAEETETASWLVRHHLLLSGTAFHRDINEPQTIRDLVETVQSLERLRLLLVLTVADIRAVGPDVWNAWKAALIRDLYFAAAEALSGGFRTAGRGARIEAAKQALGARLLQWPEEDIQAHLAGGYASYWLSLDAATHAHHAEMVRKAEAGGEVLSVDVRVDRHRGVSEITIYTSDHPGLFSQIAGAMAMSGANIVDAKIFTMTNGMALDVFWIQDATGKAFAQPARIARLEKNIERTLTGRLDPARELGARAPLTSRTRVFTVAPRVLIDNSASRTHSVIEVNGRDRPGLLHDVTRAMTDLGLQISSAHITTYGERAVDVFYVKDAFGMRISHETKLAQIRAALLGALADPARTKTPAAKTRAAAKPAATAAAGKGARKPARKPARKAARKATKGASKGAAKPRSRARRRPAGVTDAKADARE